MMRMMNNKANVKIFSIVIAAIFIVGIGALAYTQMASPSSNSGTSTIGVIDTSRMLSQDNPIYISAAQEYMSYQSQLQQETQAKIDAAQDDATKQKIAEEARQNLAKKDQEIAKLVQAQLDAGIQVITDGEYRRAFWHIDFLENLNPFKIKLWRLQKQLVMLRVLALL